MADIKSTDFSADDYIAQQAADVSKRRSKRKKPIVAGKVYSYDTGVQAVNVANKNAGFEMRGIGSPAAVLIGQRPKRPDQITLGDPDEGEGQKNQ